jgi:hypothetical protein
MSTSHYDRITSVLNKLTPKDAAKVELVFDGAASAATLTNEWSECHVGAKSEAMID